MTSVTVDIHKWGIAIVDTPITFEQMDAVRSNHHILTEAWHVMHETKPRPNPMPTKAPPGFAITERTRPATHRDRWREYKRLRRAGFSAWASFDFARGLTGVGDER